METRIFLVALYVDHFYCVSDDSKKNNLHEGHLNFTFQIKTLERQNNTQSYELCETLIRII